MPTIGAKVSQEELDSIVEYANLNGLTISNLVKKVLLREIAQSKAIAEENNKDRNEDEQVREPQTRLERIRANRRVKEGKALQDKDEQKHLTLFELLRRDRVQL